MRNLTLVTLVPSVFKNVAILALVRTRRRRSRFGGFRRRGRRWHEPLDEGAEGRPQVEKDQRRQLEVGISTEAVSARIAASTWMAFPICHRAPSTEASFSEWSYHQEILPPMPYSPKISLGTSLFQLALQVFSFIGSVRYLSESTNTRRIIISPFLEVFLYKTLMAKFKATDHVLPWKHCTRIGTLFMPKSSKCSL